MNEKEIIQNIKKSVKKTDPTADVYLFGSRAKGNPHEQSDWDILILVDRLKITNEIEDRIRDGLYPIELESGQIISAFLYPKKYWETELKFSPLYKTISEEGIQL
jgi:predicted nucleotidyltransferase